MTMKMAGHVCQSFMTCSACTEKSGHKTFCIEQNLLRAGHVACLIFTRDVWTGQVARNNWPQ